MYYNQIKTVRQLNMICFYHSADFDGKCSAALVKIRNPKCELYGIDYGQPFPFDKVKGEEVIMVDFSLQPFNNMLKLNKLAKKFVWIDHHKSAIDEYNKHMDANIAGIRSTNYAACELVYKYYWAGGIETEFPTYVYLLGRYDVWDHSDYRTIPFQFGIRVERDTSPENTDFWLSLKDYTNVTRIIENGKIILGYVEQQNKSYINACSFETSFEGYKAIAVNKMLTNSQLFDSIWDEDKYDIMIAFGWKRDRYTFSLYTTKDIDTSLISKKYGGGGHPGASGFQLDYIPFSPF